jgi:cytochrome c-type biogenesis protein
MEELLHGLLENSSIPVVSAIALGLMTAISPCPLATNITAIGYIGKDISNKNRVFVNGLIYTLGRALSYTILAALIFIGADQFKISGWFQLYGEKIIGPLLIIIGLIMLGLLKIPFPGFSQFTKRYRATGVNSYLDVLLLGILFALAFCPYSGILYFGMLIPMTISSPSGLFLPLVFATATGIPVIIFAWLLAYTASGVGRLYKGLKVFEIWFRRLIAIVFIGVGTYYVITTLF